MAERYRKEVSGLIAAMHDKTHGQEAIEIVRSLIERVVLTPDPNSDGLLINLYGDLAGIVKIAAGKKEFEGEEEETLKLIRIVTGLAPTAGANRVTTNSSVKTFPLQERLVAGERSNLSLHFIRSSTNSRTGAPLNIGFPIMQDKMVGPAGLEPATRPL